MGVISPHIYEYMYIYNWELSNIYPYIYISGTATCALMLSTNINMFIRTKIQGIKVHIMTFKYL